MNTKNITFTFDLVEEWLQIAAIVERSMPPVKPMGYPPCSLVVIRSAMEIMLMEKPDKPKFRPSITQVSIWEEVVLNWFNLIDSIENRKIVWLRSCGMGWRRIAERFGLSRQTVSNRYKNSINELLWNLENKYNRL